MGISRGLIFMVCVYAMLRIIRAQHPGITREYCMETFSPKCSDNSVVLIQRAMYGRMAIGRCMKNDFGLPSCSQDELVFLDSLCSGRWGCDLVVPSPELAAKQGCLSGMTSYLEASYTCQKVYIPPNKIRCVSPEKVQANKKPRYLASAVSIKTQCGLHESPWIIEAQPGQRLNLDLIDLAWQNGSIGKHNHRDCTHKYGYILDMENDEVINICGGGARDKHLYSSVGSSVQIVLESAVLQTKYFLIKYQAKGCPKYKTPTHAWAQMENDTMVIRCNHGDKEWKVRCVDNIWLGIVGNCTPPPVSPEVKVEVKPVKDASVQQSESSTIPSVSNNHVLAFALGCITLIVCCTIVFLGVYCTKRYEAHVLEKIGKGLSSSPVFPDGTTIKPVRSSIIYKPMAMSGGTIKSTATMDLPPYTFPKPKAERTPKLPKRNANINDPMITSTNSDYLTPQDDTIGENDENSVMYYILENPAESMGNMSEEMYQSIHLHNSLQSNKN